MRDEAEEDPTPEVGVEICVGVVLDGVKFGVVLFISDPSKAGVGGG